MTKNFGKIVKFESNQVVNNDPKPKYHVVLSLGDLSFLFISSNPFDDSFEITQTDWEEMPNEFSSISCNKVIRYDAEYLKSLKGEVFGELSRDCLQRLRDHLPNSESMETKDILYAISIFDKNLN